MSIKWNDKQKEIAHLIEQGKTFEDIVKSGYANSTVGRVRDALKRGESPAKQLEKTLVPATGQNTSLATILIPKTGVAIFSVGQDLIKIYPEDIYSMFDLYRDMRDLINWESDFSSTMRQGFKMYRAVMCNLLGGGDDNE